MTAPNDGDGSGDGTDAGTTQDTTSGSGQGGNDAGTPPAKTFTQEQLDREIDKRLKRERARFSDYDDLKAKAKEREAAEKANQTLEQRVEALQKAAADRDAADVQAKADVAAERLQAKLVRGGLSDDDAVELLETIDPLRLLADGKPSSEAIDKVAKALLKIGTRASADPDQGRSGGTAAPSMNQLIREAAGRTRVG